MIEESSRRILTNATIDAHVSVPPSKSYTNRALIAAALAEGSSTLLRPSRSDDSEYLVAALHEFGVATSLNGDSLEIQGTSGKLNVPTKEIFVGNAGTTFRFLSTFASLVPGDVTINGDKQMQKRPINGLLEALRLSGLRCTSNNGFPPVKIHGGKFNGGSIEIDGSVSSQFVSSLLLSAPYAKHPVVLRVKGRLSSLPYIDMTLHVMRTFGAEVRVIDPFIFQVSNTDHYVGQSFHIEDDASSATYFFAAAAITGGRVTILNLSPDSLQGDIRFLKILEEMGCRVRHHDLGIEVQGDDLVGIEVDMNDIPDCVPTLAVIAAFADGPTTISNVRHLEFKETNRLTALASELAKIGAKVTLNADGLIITPQTLRGAAIETYNDHRIAMSFAIAGLRVQGITIKNPTCVTKSFPNFWDELTKLEGKE